MQRIEIQPQINSANIFLGLFIFLCAFAAILIGAFPLEASIITIFLFAGIHNFMEFRYFLARMPLRWGKSKSFYAFGIGGTIILAGIYLAIYFGSGRWLWSLDASVIATASWNTLFILWIGLLFYLRGRQRPKSDWAWAFPAAFLFAGLAWIFPMYWSLSLVYLHPLVAMWFLERQIRRSKPEWLNAYHICLAAIPFFLIALWLAFANKPNLSEETNLFWVIVNHAGAGILPNISSHFLVAAHVFLESIHYAVWIFLIPLADKRAIPWRLSGIPLFENKEGFPKLVFTGIAISIIIVFTLWAGFSVNYAFTRDLYFAFAMAHVLAEMPFLIKML